MINDFIEYWTATRLLLQGGNPYSPTELLAAQRTLGWAEAEPLMMWNPPWTLSFTLPFGLVDYETAQFVWFLSHALILFVGSQVLWKIYGGSARKSQYPMIAVLSFAPTYFALLLGQIGPLVLLGLIGFLASVKRNAWVLAGASLTIAAIKPHLLYLVWLALLFWTVKEKKWQPGIAFLAAGISFASLPLLFDREVYSHYFELLDRGGVVRPLEWATPSLGTALAQLFAVADAWIRWLPGLAGTVWLFWYWSRRNRQWDWMRELPLLLPVSIATASFAWTFDHIVLLPAVVQAAVWISQCEAKRKRATFIGMHVALAVTLVLMKIFVRNDFWYFWAAPAYLLLYLYARAAMGTLNTSMTKAVHP
jgi:hypothetical protein